MGGSDDPRIEEFTDYVLEMKRLTFRTRDFGDTDDPLGRLGDSLVELAQVMDRWYRDQNRLLDITEKINQGIFINDVLDYVYNTFRPVIPYDLLGFALVEDDDRVVRSHWARSESENIQLGLGYAQRLEGTSLSELLESGEPRVLNDLESYYKAHPDSDSTRLILAEGIHSSLTCPLIAMGRPIGFIFFSSQQKNTYENVHQDLFKRIASQLAVIVEKSRLYEDLHKLNGELVSARKGLQHQATHDGLTGLWNHSAILEFLEQELARTKRADGTAAALMVDIDHFKSINDEYGHQTGDIVLKEVARRLEDVARKGDTVGRYGGEEFLVILSQANVLGAQTAAERYRARVAGAPVDVDGVRIPVTVSLGTGVIENMNGVSAEALVKNADSALYTAKNAGRNRVEFRTVR
jgi:diguanylate cyclase (GGDEF)-like protein